MSDQLAMTEILESSDEALFLDAAETRKRYTATTVEKLELKRNYILDLIACGLPADLIAEKTKASTRTVRLLGAKYAQQVAASIPQFTAALRGKAARWMQLADTKAEDAKFGELMVGTGIALQRAQELELAGAAAGDINDPAHELAAEDPQLVAARKFLEAKLNPPPKALPPAEVIEA